MIYIIEKSVQSGKDRIRTLSLNKRLHFSYTYNLYSYLEPCALNAEFQHFIPRFNKTSLLCGHHSKRGYGVKRGPKTDRVKTG